MKKKDLKLRIKQLESGVETYRLLLTMALNNIHTLVDKPQIQNPPPNDDRQTEKSIEQINNEFYENFKKCNAADHEADNALREQMNEAYMKEVSIKNPPPAEPMKPEDFEKVKRWMRCFEGTYKSKPVSFTINGNNDSKVEKIHDIEL